MRIGTFEIAEPAPELSNTIAIAMLRPWIDVGRVGTLALRKLENHFGAKELGRLARPGNFFDFTRYRPRMGFAAGERTFTIPNTVVNFIDDEALGRPLLLLHIREPHALGEDYADGIAEMLTHFQVTEYCRIGGMYDSVPHTRSLLVTGTLDDEKAEKVKGLVSPRRSTYQGPTSIVNLVTEAASRLEIATPSLMVHLPQYVQLDEDHMGASRLIEVLCASYGFPKSLADPTRGQQQYLDIGRAIESNPEVKNLIRKFETYYDRVLAAQGPEDQDDVPLSPDVEEFLRNVGKRLEGESGSDDKD